ncbi:MAG: diaminopimelate epimerase [Candidatus Thiocaldithrix dubininis]|uniref:Diaminopimelate epimerase n=1 Tax=Candidatus Thiocaldithrix dubininis TaxID=3080823 RepID=A0AA95H561_9GAMM|nr:MAG: diaminopimelate epimerase [Candidatus Thiocaldithrix dubininis]
MSGQIIEFSKMQGAGNDFMVIDAIRQTIDLSSAQIQQLANRHFGIGFDQLLMVEQYTGEDADFRYRIFNSDGSEVEQCGNGARCFARFVYEQGLTQKTTIPVMTKAGRIELRLQADGQVTVNMGVPQLEPAQIPFKAAQRQTRYELALNEQNIHLSAVSMGNPHAVLRVDEVDIAPVAEWGAAIETHPQFPQRVNVGFMQVLDSAHIRLRVFERGAGETLACGTGACAAVVAGRLLGILAESVSVQLRGGNLQIQWLGEGQPVWMTGPAVTVYRGTISV